MTHYVLLHADEKRIAVGKSSIDPYIAEFLTEIREFAQKTSPQKTLLQCALLLDIEENVQSLADIVGICNKHQIPYRTLFFNTDNQWQEYSNKQISQ